MISSRYHSNISYFNVEFFIGTGSSYVLRQTKIGIYRLEDCGAYSPNMLCGGQTSPTVHDSCQVRRN